MGRNNRNYWFIGWQAQYQFSDHVTLGAEIFHTTGQVVGQSASTGFNAGGYYNFDEHNHLLFSAEFADRDLEALSAGEKIMLRIGRDNAARIRAKLREIRRELTASIVGDRGR